MSNSMIYMYSDFFYLVQDLVSNQLCIMYGKFILFLRIYNLKIHIINKEPSLIDLGVVKLIYQKIFLC